MYPLSLRPWLRTASAPFVTPYFGSIITKFYCKLQQSKALDYLDVCVGYWPLGLEVCGVWQVSDVTLCTSSIMHLCTISIDRFIGIRNPMVTRNRSPWIVSVKIGFVWILSFLVASPLYFVLYFSPHEVLEPKVRHCSIMNRPFLVYGSIVAFFVPLVIMLVTYTLSMRVLTRQVTLLSQDSFDKGLQRSKKSGTPQQNEGKRLQTSEKRVIVDRPVKLDQIHSSSERFKAPNGDLRPSQTEQCSSESMNSNERRFVMLSRRQQTVDSRRGSFEQRRRRFFRQDEGGSCACAPRRRELQQKRTGNYLRINSSEENKVVPYLEIPSLFLLRTTGRVVDPGSEDDDSTPNSRNNSETGVLSPSRQHDRSVTRSPTNETLEIDEEAPNGDRFSCACQRWLTKPLQAIKRRVHDRAASNNSPSFGSTTAFDSVEPSHPPAGETTPSAAGSYRFKSLVQKHSATIRVAGILIAKRERQKKEALHSVRNERKAIRVLGAMFSIFIVCWAPFFTVNLAVGICKDCHTGTLLFRTCLWLGYVSSTLNPIVYTVFNRSFRKTFLDIILPQRQCCRR